MIVLRGEPTLRTHEGEQQLREGDVVAFPRGKEGAHQIRNDTDAPVRVLMLSTLIAPDIVEYLDTGKIGARSVAGERIICASPGAPSSNIGRTRTSRSSMSALASVGRRRRGRDATGRPVFRCRGDNAPSRVQRNDVDVYSCGFGVARVPSRSYAVADERNLERADEARAALHRARPGRGEGLAA